MCQFVNSAIASLETEVILNANAVQCNIHLIHSNITTWVKSTPGFDQAMRNINKTMSQLKVMVKNTVSISNLTKVKAK